MNLKFMWNGIKIEGKLYKAWFSKVTYTEQSKIPARTITIYVESTSNVLPLIDGLNTINNFDSMTDYFEKTKIRVTPDNEFFNAVCEAFEKQEAHRAAKIAKRLNK